MSKSSLAACALAVSLLAAPGFARDKNTSKTRGSASRTTDTTFMMKAAQGSLAEIELGNLAQQKANSQAVKDLASRLVADHTKASDQLKQIAQKDNVQLPATLRPQDQKLRDHLASLSGPEFDRMYTQHMMADHKKDIAEFRKEARSGTNPDTKQFASQTLPVLEEHLKMTQQVNQQIKRTK